MLLAGGSGLLQLRTWLLNRRKNRADGYNLELLSILELLEGSPKGDDLETARTRLLDSREEERRLLTSTELRQFLEEQKIRVISYREFAETSAETPAKIRS